MSLWVRENNNKKKKKYLPYHNNSHCCQQARTSVITATFTTRTTTTPTNSSHRTPTLRLAAVTLVAILTAGVGVATTTTESTTSRTDNHEHSMMEPIDSSDGHDPNAAVMATSSSSSSLSSANGLTSQEYDFVVVGYGTAGQTAVRTLQQTCPHATVAVLDPFLVASSSGSSSSSSSSSATTTSSSSSVEFYPSSRVTELDPRTNQCVVVTSTHSEHVIQYRHAILIATGCRGAPIPTYLLDEKAQSRTYEYRPTTIPTTTMNHMEANHKPRPFQSPDDVRKFIQHQVRTTGDTMAVLGSGWEALDLVATMAITSSVKRPPRQSSRIGDDDTTNATTFAPRQHAWIYGSYGPVSHTVPTYLSIEIAKRLQSKRITILDRSLIRYISFIGDRTPSSTTTTTSSTSTTTKSPAQLQVYTAKSYDFLDGKAVPADYVIVAPDVHGARGTGAFPTFHIPSFLRDKTNAHNHTSWYHTWSSLTTMDDVDDDDDDDNDDDDDITSLLACYKDDGRIAVNAELYAGGNVFAAGSVAKYPNARNGHATVAGAGVVDGTNAGYIAAMNMAQRYYQATAPRHRHGLLPFGRHVHPTRDHDRSYQMYVKDPIPIWRSDLRIGSNHGNDTTQQRSSLEDVGVMALCVGHCDSESLATHGVWWTNHAAHRRLLAMAEMNDGTNSHSRQERRKMKQSFKPVYGFGVVFYLDRANQINGVMTWGLPFYQSNRNRDLDLEFVEQIKHVIKTNGGFRRIESEQDRIEFTQYLGRVSKELIVRAFSNHETDIGTHHQLDGRLDRLPRPLHRYTEIRPPNVRAVGLLKRNDGQNLGILGQDLFVRFEQDDVPDNPIPLPLAANLGSAIAKVQAQYDWDVWEQIERRWDENESRARPSKEDPLWIRKGDEGRALSHREQLAAAYHKALGGQ